MSDPPVRVETFWPPLARRYWFLFPVAVLLLSYADYLRCGNGVYQEVATNFETPRASSGERVVSHTYQSEFLGRVYNVTVAIGAETGGGIWRVPRNSDMRLQLASDWKTRLLVIRPGHPESITAWGVLTEVLKGEARLLVVPHRGWIRLGRLPDGVAPFQVQIYGLLPGRFGFVRLGEEKAPDFRIFDISVVDEKATGSVSGTIRYQLAVSAPVGPGEATKRFFFFASASRVLQGGLLVAVALLFFGTFLFSRERVVVGCSALIVSVMLFHTVCLPPLHGADETTHGAAVEKIVFTGKHTKEYAPYPKSVFLFAEALEQDRVQFNPEIPLPLGDDAARRKLRNVVENPLSEEALSGGYSAPLSGVQDSRNRSLLFFGAFTLFPNSARHLSVLDRFSSYRLVSNILGILAVLAGVALMGKAGFSSQALILYALVATLPFSVAVMASISNYAPAVGIGAFLSAATLTVATSAKRVWRLVGGFLLVLGSIVATLVWRDFAILAAVSALVLTWTSLALLLAKVPALMRQRWIPWSLPALPALAAAWVLFPVLSRYRLTSLENRFKGDFTLGDPSIRPYFFAIAAPFFVIGTTALILFGFRYFLRRSPAAVGRPSVAASLTILVAVAVAFVATPFYTLPYEYRWLPLPEAIEAWARAFASNNLAWDQDRITWKFTFGTFGWLDTYYPDWVYAIARWLSIALLVALPVLTKPFREERRATAIRLFLIFGAGLSIVSAPALFRMLPNSQIFPSSRFVLPLVPVAFLPLLVQVEAPGRSKVLAALFHALVALNVWTAIRVLGARYYLGSPFPI